ncbi:hypothetical protein Tco_1251192 [Tanacetum coccineum]
MGSVVVVWEVVLSDGCGGGVRQMRWLSWRGRGWRSDGDGGDDVCDGAREAVAAWVAVEWWSQRGVEVVGGAWCDDDEGEGDGGDDVGCGVVIEVMMVWWQRGGVGWQRRRLAEISPE